MRHKAHELRHTCKRTHTHTDAHMHMQTRTHTHTHTHTHANAHTRTHTHTRNTHMQHTHTHTHTRTHAHTHTHTHTHTLAHAFTRNMLKYTPSGKPGKFSTSVVVVSWPPAAMSLAMKPCARFRKQGSRPLFTC